MEEKQWYVVTTYSGYENKVKEYLERRIDSMGLQELIECVMVPEVEEVNAEGKVKKKKIFPGYVLIKMHITDEAWYIVRNTPNVTGFVGSSGGGAKPIPLLPEEVDDIMNQMKNAQTKVDFAVEDKVLILNEAFKDLVGVVKAIDLETKKATVVTAMLGRDTEVDIDFDELRKI